MKTPYLLVTAAVVLALLATGCTTERVVRERTVVEPVPVAAPAPAVVEVIAPQPPPTRVVEEIVPRPGYVWARGYWHWTGQRYVWRKGHWELARVGYHYVPAHYVQHRDGWHLKVGIWVEG